MDSTEKEATIVCHRKTKEKIYKFCPNISTATMDLNSVMFANVGYISTFHLSSILHVYSIVGDILKIGNV